MEKKYEFYVDRFTAGTKRFLLEIEANDHKEAQEQAIIYEKSDNKDEIKSVEESFIEDEVGDLVGGFELYSEKTNWQYGEC